MAPLILLLLLAVFKRLSWRTSCSSLALRVPVVSVVLLLCAGPCLCKGVDHFRLPGLPVAGGSGEERSRQRRLEGDAQGSVVTVTILNKELLVNRTSVVLPPPLTASSGVSGTPNSTTGSSRIFAIDLVFNETTNDSAVYYLEYNNVSNDSAPRGFSRTYTVKKAEKRSVSSTEYTVSDVAGPWPRNDDISSFTSTLLQDLGRLAIVDATSLVVADTVNSLIRKVDYINGKEEEILSENAPTGIAKNPKEPNILFVSTVDRIFSIPLDSPKPSNILGIAGPVAHALDRGYEDSQNRVEVRFDISQIAPQSVSQDGSILYVADERNNVVRRVDTVTGATTTIAGHLVEGDIDGLATVAKFKQPNTVAVTSDGCNLFVTNAGNRGLRWLTMEQPHGRVREVKTIMTIQNSEDSSSSSSSSTTTTTARIVSVILSKDEQFLFAATLGGQILKFGLNASALHQCNDSLSSFPIPPSSSSTPQWQSRVPSPISSPSPVPSVKYSLGIPVIVTLSVVVMATILTISCCVFMCVMMVYRRRRRRFVELALGGEISSSIRSRSSSKIIFKTGETGTQGRQSQSVSLLDGRAFGSCQEVAGE